MSNHNSKIGADTAGTAVVMLSEDSLCLHSDGRVTGQVFLDVCGVAFPDDQWNDFPVTVLTWWLAGLHALIHHAKSDEVFAFMDGPFEFLCSSFDDRLQLKTVDRRSEAICSYVVDRNAFIRSVVDAARVLLAWVKRQPNPVFESDNLGDAIAMFGQYRPIQKLFPT
jgi:hypothetical protein